MTGMSEYYYEELGKEHTVTKDKIVEAGVHVEVHKYASACLKVVKSLLIRSWQTWAADSPTRSVNFQVCTKFSKINPSHL